MRNQNGKYSYKTRVGIVGSGFISRGLALLIDKSADLHVSKVLTRRNPSEVTTYPRPDALTDQIEELLDFSDLIVECSGDVIHATQVVDAAMARGLPVVTMNAEFQVTTGSYFVGKGVLSEAEGDQPGSLAALAEDAIAMGFRPRVYGNVKAFLNHHPTPEEMSYWAGRNGISIDQVTAFTDGTKVQVEQVLVANGLSGDIATSGLLGPKAESMQEGARVLAEFSRQSGLVISDYVVSRDWSGAVFLVAEHDADQADYLRYYKLGDGPDYVIPRPFHLCHLEVVKTIRRVLGGGPALLTNSFAPRFGVAAIAKTGLEPGTSIPRGMGGFKVRGEAVRLTEQPDHVPIGLLFDATICRRVEPDQVLTFDDVELPDSLALAAWREIRGRAISIESVAAQLATA